MPVETLWVILGFLGPFSVLGIVLGIIIFRQNHRRHSDTI
jgi:hypothetical protein